MSVRLKRPMYSQHNPKGPTKGLDVRIAKFACRRYEDNLMPRGGWATDTEHFGPALYQAVKVVQRREGIQDSGDIGQATWDVLWLYLDDYRKSRYRLWKVPSLPRPNPVPDLGPICVGGASILQHSLTHRTAGFPNAGHPSYYPAYDDGWVAGKTVIAPEDIVVTEASSANPGDAFYAAGASRLLYWFGHLQLAPGVGLRFKKGAAVGKIAWQPNDKSHVHVGIDGRALLGGRDFVHHTDYTTGAPTVGTQLKEALSL